NLSSAGGVYPQIAVDSSDSIDVSWTFIGSSQSDIYFSQSRDGGQTFSAPVNVSHNPGSGQIGQSWLATDDTGNIFLTWRVGGAAVFFSRSQDGGRTFSSPQAISANPSTADPEMALDSNGNINIVWTEE